MGLGFFPSFFVSSSFGFVSYFGFRTSEEPTPVCQSDWGLDTWRHLLGLELLWTVYDCIRDEPKAFIWTEIPKNRW